MSYLAKSIIAAVVLAMFVAISGTGSDLRAQTVGVPGAGGETAPAEIKLPDPLTPEAIRELVSTLSDGQVRSLLLERLDAVAKAEKEKEAGTSVAQFVERSVTGIWDSIFEAVVRVPLLWESQSRSFLNFYDRLGWSGIGTLFGSLLLAILAGATVEFLVNRWSRNWHADALNQQHPDTLRDTLRFLFFRLCNDMYGLIAFFIVTRSVTVNLVPQEFHSFSQTIMLNLVVLPRLGAAFIRFILAPNAPQFRIVHTDDETAKIAYRHQIGIFVLMGFSIAIVNFNDLNGVSMGQSRLGFWLNLAVHLYVIWLVWRVWDGLVMMMRGADPEVTPLEEKVARIYPAYCIGVSIVTWLIVNVLVAFEQFELLQTAPHYKMMFLLTMVAFMDTAVRGLVRHLVPPMRGEGVVAQRAYASTKRSYIRVGRVVVFAIVLITIADFWGLDPSTMAAAGVGAQLAGRVIENLMILAVGYFIWEMITLLFNRKLAAEHTAAGFDLDSDEPGGGEGGGQGGSRLSTVLPMMRLAAQVVIATMTVLIFISNMGVDVTPLLAGAGIIGLAIGFGAQTLVRDVVSGLFFLIDDAFRVGEYLVVGDTVGTVEKISVRSLQLRHHNGPVHTIPYGEIPKITNNSRDWVIMKLKWTLPFGTDTFKVKKLFKEIGKEMMEAEYAGDLIQTFKSQGVYDVDDIGIVIRGKFMAKPGTQWVIRKDVYSRVQKKLEANGIDFARREVRVQLGDGPDSNNLTNEQKETVAAAAAETVQSAADKEAKQPAQ